jgi:acyl-coenzyme A synthetase/AMP-(fatty) acid ligase
MEALVEHISGRLPSYAVPTKITIMDKFPRTSTGKINRRELQALHTDLSHPQQGTIPILTREDNHS